MNPIYVLGCIIGSHCNSLLHLVWTKKSVVQDFIVEGLFWNLSYFNDNGRLDCIILYTEFLHDNLSVCIISTVRTLNFNKYVLLGICLKRKIKSVIIWLKIMINHLKILIYWKEIIQSLNSHSYLYRFRHGSGTYSGHWFHVFWLELP